MARESPLPLCSIEVPTQLYCMVSSLIKLYVYVCFMKKANDFEAIMAEILLVLHSRESTLDGADGAAVSFVSKKDLNK